MKQVGGTVFVTHFTADTYRSYQYDLSGRGLEGVTPVRHGVHAVPGPSEREANQVPHIWFIFHHQDAVGQRLHLIPAPTTLRRKPTSMGHADAKGWPAPGCCARSATCAVRAPRHRGR
jgi:hypothetical protein